MPATGVARLGEVSKLRVALDHVAILSMVVVVAQGSLQAQVGHRCVTDAVPARLYRDGALVLLLDDATLYRQCASLGHLDGVSLLRRDYHVLHVARGYPLLVLVNHRQVAAQVGQHVVLSP